MSDVLKELEKFREQAKEFSESFLGSIKENYFLYEADESSEAKPTKPSDKNSKNIARANKKLASWKEENPKASKEEYESFKDALAVFLGVDASKIHAAERKPSRQDTSEEPAERKPLSPEERREADKKAHASREEFQKKQDSDLKKRTQNQNKPQPSSHEKFTKIPAGMGGKDYKEHVGKQQDAENKIKQMMASYKEKHPDATPEKLSDILSKIRQIIANEEDKKAKEKEENEKIGFNLPTKSDTAKEKIKKNFAPKSLQRRKLGSKITSQTSDSKVLPFAKELVQKYINAKNRMASYPGSSPHSREDELAITTIEDLIGLPAYNPESPESKQQFAQAVTSFYSEPTKFLPAPFLQSSLRSYPEELSDKISSDISAKNDKGPDFGEFMGSLKDLGPHAQRKEMRKLDLKMPSDIKSNRLVNYLSEIPMEDLVKLFSYFKNHEDEISVSEREYRTPDFVAGAGGFEGKTTGDIEDESPVDDPDMPDAIGDLEREAKDPELKHSHSAFFDVMNSKHQLGNYFNDFDDLLRASEGGGNKIGMASAFLEKILSDPGTQGLVIKALARQYAMSNMENKLKAEFTEQNFDKQPPEKRRDMIKWALANYNAEKLNAQAKESLPQIKAALGQLKTTTKDGRITLKNPQTNVWPNENMKKIAMSIFNKLAPNKLIHDLKGASGEGTPLENFMLSKADEVHKRILNVIKSIGNRQLVHQQKSDIERDLSKPSSPETVRAAKQKRIDAEMNKMNRKSDIEREKERLELPKHHNMPGGKMGQDKLFPTGMDPKLSPHVPELWGDLDPSLRSAVSDFRQANPGAGRAEIANFISMFRKMNAQNESFKDEIYYNLFLEGKEINSVNVRNYLIKAVRNNIISKDKLYEVLFDINGEIQSTAREDDWETANKKKRRRAIGG